MATKLKDYGARINGELYPCALNDKVYSQDGIAAACGFEKPGSNLNFNGTGDFRSLKRAGAILRINVTGSKTEGTAEVSKTFRLYCVASNLSNARGNLVNKTIDGYNINKVSARQTTRYR
jgi:hypothetical protein